MRGQTARKPNESRQSNGSKNANRKRKGNRMPEPVCNLFTEDAMGVPCG